MRMNLKVALTASAAVGLGFLAACSDSATAPNSSKFVSEVSRATGDVTNTPAPEAVVQKIIVCKTGNAGGSFSFARSTSGTPVGSTWVGAGPIVIATGTCLEVANDASPSGNGSTITVTEAAAANTVQTITACRQAGTGGVVDCVFANGGSLFLNQFHGYVITYNNVFTPPPAGCTYTKGWYQNPNGAPTVIAVDGRTIAEAQAIFAATPGQPGNVTWGVGNSPNSLLNLYQQLLAALNNLGGDANEDDGPAAVDAAIDAAQNGTGGVGLNITTTLTQQQIGALTAVLSAFNEGTYEGWPHCDDEIIVSN